MTVIIGVDPHKSTHTVVGEPADRDPRTLRTHAQRPPRSSIRQICRGVCCPRSALGGQGKTQSPVDIGVRYRRAGPIGSVAMQEFLRGAVKLHVLHHAAEGDVHGAWMAEELANHGYKISPGTLYPTLHRMEAEGLLVSQREVFDGRSRRVYTATKKGRAVLAETREALRELAEEVLG